MPHDKKDEEMNPFFFIKSNALYAKHSLNFTPRPQTTTLSSKRLSFWSAFS